MSLLIKLYHSSRLISHSIHNLEWTKNRDETEIYTCFAESVDQSIVIFSVSINTEKFSIESAVFELQFDLFLFSGHGIR